VVVVVLMLLEYVKKQRLRRQAGEVKHHHLVQHLNLEPIDGCSSTCFHSVFCLLL
jgi:hypothetical protein